MEDLDLTARLRQARDNTYAADRLIEEYLPFIRSETAKFLDRPVREEQDDELSIAMIAFHEAIGSYESRRGGFLPYAARVIHSRLVDYQRREKRHSRHLSLDAPTGDADSGSLLDTLAHPGDHAGELELREATAYEIRELETQMNRMGVSLADVADNCPRQRRTLQACRAAMEYAKSRPELLEELVRTGKLPMGELAAGTGVDRKTLERHRKYLVALLLICTNGYEIIRGHLHQVLKGGSGQ